MQMINDPESLQKDCKSNTMHSAHYFASCSATLKTEMYEILKYI